nr:hypothetical protein [Sphingomonas sp. 66-10]
MQHAIGRDRREGQAEDHVAHVRLAQQRSRHRGQLGEFLAPVDRPRRRYGHIIGIERAPHRLADHRADQQRDDHPGDADRDEGDAPAEMLRHPAAERRADHRPDRAAEHIDADRRSAAVGRIIIGDQRKGRRRQPRLAHPDPDPREQQLGVIARDAACGGEPRPDDHRDRDDRYAMPPFGEPRDGQPEHRIEDREGEPAEQAELGIAQLHVDLDRLADDRDHRAIEDVERIGQHEQREHAMRVKP